LIAKLAKKIECAKKIEIRGSRVQFGLDECVLNEIPRPAASPPSAEAEVYHLKTRDFGMTLIKGTDLNRSVPVKDIFYVVCRVVI
jgi:hypothetical protein